MPSSPTPPARPTQSPRTMESPTSGGPTAHHRPLHDQDRRRAEPGADDPVARPRWTRRGPAAAHPPRRRRDVLRVSGTIASWSATGASSRHRRLRVRANGCCRTRSLVDLGARGDPRHVRRSAGTEGALGVSACKGSSAKWHVPSSGRGADARAEHPDVADSRAHGGLRHRPGRAAAHAVEESRAGRASSHTHMGGARPPGRRQRTAIQAARPTRSRRPRILSYGQRPDVTTGVIPSGKRTASSR